MNRYYSDLKAISDTINNNINCVIKHYSSIEGIQGSGKTTFIKKVSELQFPNIEIGAELPLPINGENGKNYVKQESFRKNSIDLCIGRNINYISDRSIFSTLTIAFAKTQLLRNNEWKETIECLSQFIEQKKIYFPQNILHLNVDNETSISRQKERNCGRPVNKTWISPNFIDNIRRSYEMVYRVLNENDVPINIINLYPPNLNDNYDLYVKKTINTLHNKTYKQ